MSGRSASNEVCACLLETGSRQVEIVERCVRCGLCMDSDAYADALARADRYEKALREARQDYVTLFGKVSDAERFDTNAGDSAVSCVLAGAQQTCTLHANALAGEDA